MKSEERKAGRPKLGARRRVRIMTTIEPLKLAALRLHAQQMDMSLGQIADEYVSQHLVQEMGDVTSDNNT